MLEARNVFVIVIVVCYIFFFKSWNFVSSVLYCSFVYFLFVLLFLWLLLLLLLLGL